MLRKEITAVLLHPARALVVLSFIPLLFLVFLARVFWLQDEAASHACALGATSFQCSLRSVMGMLMYSEALGIASIPAACLALWFRRPVIMVPALGLTVLALVFYNADYAALAATFLIVAVARADTGQSLAVSHGSEGEGKEQKGSSVRTLT